MVLTHRYAEAWTIPHRTSSHSRFVNEADARRSGSTALTTAIGHDSIEVPSPSDPVINVEFPTNELKTLKKALAAGDCVLALSGGGGAVDGISCATSTGKHSSM